VLTATTIEFPVATLASLRIDITVYLFASVVQNIGTVFSMLLYFPYLLQQNIASKVHKEDGGPIFPFALASLD
jgi:hypothetical protein